MLGSHKKKNPEAALATTGGSQSQAMIPRDVPPLRSFVLYGRNYGSRPRHGELLAKDDVRGYQIDAHGLAIDEERMISFVVFFFLDPDHKTQPMQATKLVVNADDWSEVEEINPLFPTLKGN